MSSVPSSAHPIATSVFNDAYIAEQFERYRRDPSSVEESWRQFFRFAEGLTGLVSPAGAVAADESLLRKVAAAAALAHAIRQYGHLAVQVDPLGSPPLGAAELTPAFHGITEDDLRQVPASALGFDGAGTAYDVMQRLRALYCGKIGFEFEHLEEEAEREWFLRQVEGGEMPRALDAERQKAVLRRLTEVDALERFLGRAYQGKKRFSIEGTDALVPMLDAAIARAGSEGAREVVIGMAHRGRLNVLTHVLGKPYATLFAEFEGIHASTNSAADTGDVKYHMGYESDRRLPDGTTMHLTLMPNPSHLELVNPVVLGAARAKERTSGAAAGKARDESCVLTILVHGDAAFIGEGIVAETFNLSLLRGYRVGGTLHIIANNQVGFTTDPQDGRSTYYSSDLAKGFDLPIVHVNADDPEACLAAVWLGTEYRKRFGKDFIIDLVGYRRHGHNETDEPVWTQPKLYALIHQHPTPAKVWAARLVERGVVSEAEAAQLEQEVMSGLQRTLDQMKAAPVPADQAIGAPHDGQATAAPAMPAPGAAETAVKRDVLVGLNERLLTWPSTFKANQRLARQLERRRDNLESQIDWGHAEALALGSLLVEGTSVRLTGQDVERGTFSHRQAVLHDMETGEIYVPLQHLPDARGSLEIYNSPLSETAVLGFEYGFSVAAPDALTLWEAQFGDFANVAQPIMDQFLAADRAKWGQDSGLVLLLPHGYEGQGPEHSSARLERFLQLYAEENLVVAYPSTPAQYFHVLRWQAKRHPRRPLVLMQPKSLLRLREAASSLAELAEGSFRPVLDDPKASQKREAVRRLVFCTGKVYYDLALSDKRTEQVAIARVEALAPWPAQEVSRLIDRYPALEEIVWVQEEPRNMGAWTYVAPRLRASVGNQLPMRYIGRPEHASPAEGYESDHREEQGRIVAEALEPLPAARGKTGAAARR